MAKARIKETTENPMNMATVIKKTSMMTSETMMGSPLERALRMATKSLQAKLMLANMTVNLPERRMMMRIVNPQVYLTQIVILQESLMVIRLVKIMKESRRAKIPMIAKRKKNKMKTIAKKNNKKMMMMTKKTKKMMMKKMMKMINAPSLMMLLSL
jgi:hypothetical protein